ncbi:TIGR03619 family F420-dependent LLM class oxidoreductase [Rhodococcoides yunnanense]|uniref:TIGR03619 family F420-dependent LLM class oxidoreductase n=1 Tax=Rhodococcoides yunnanense TaxID=278209 RepID=UPI0009343C46|nr:TIGR03619 family F420-dependent LLM class oxidoreductase [Rhodococcus yunnanensis]
MQFGIPLAVDAADVPEFARSAEQIGVAAGWVPEHLAWPVSIDTTYPYKSDGRPPVSTGFPTHDPWVLLSAAAATTTTMRLGTSIYILPLRDPHVTARAVGTLDLVSRGRAVLGVGVGWMEEEFEAVGQDFASRGKRTDEIIDILRGLWSAGTYGHESEHYSFRPVHFEPKPPQGALLPILVGGESPRALRRAAEVGDGWIGLDHTVESVQPRLDRLRAVRAASERAEQPLTVALRISPTSTADDIKRFEDLGIDEVRMQAWEPGVEPPELGLERVQRLIDAVNG